VTPEGATTKVIKQKRNDKKKELFKIAFGGEDTTHDLSDEQINK